jgi:uncharacterized membrane protein YfcA
MDVLHSIDLPYSVAGFAVGTLVGLTGVGGGSLMTPLLILLFGVHPATAVGTDLLYAAATKSAGAMVHGWSRTIDWQVVRRLASGSVPATALTLLALSQLNLHSEPAQMLVTAVLAGALLMTAVALVLRNRIIHSYADRISDLTARQIAILTVSVGAVLGTLVSITSVGAGAIGVMALILLYPQLPIARIVGSDIAHAVPLTLVAGTGHWMLGSVDWQIFAPLIFGSVPGILFGSLVAVRLPEQALRLMLAGTLIIVATKLSFDLYSASTSDAASITAAVPR